MNEVLIFSEKSTLCCRDLYNETITMKKYDCTQCKVDLLVQLEPLLHCDFAGIALFKEHIRLIC